MESRKKHKKALSTRAFFVLHVTENSLYQLECTEKVGDLEGSSLRCV